MVLLKRNFISANKSGQIEFMSEFFDEKIESELLGFIQNHYGGEVFTPGLLRTRPLYLPFIKKVAEVGTKVTIISGTNGKGQTAHTLAHYLLFSDQKFALWTSPHILSLRERFHFEDGDVSYGDLSKEIYETHEFLKTEHVDVKVSFYEFLFLVFLRLSLLKRTRIDHLLLEVGLGGKLDAVNHFDADCTCITSISRDHQAILGNRYDLILQEKIAVARAGKPLFTQFRLEYLNELTKSYCQNNGVLWRPLEIFKQNSGNYFLENQIMAQALFRELLPNREIPGESQVPLFKGRREEMTFNGNTLIFIGAHNIDGVRRMTELFSADPKELLPTRVLMSFSKRPVQEVEVMLKTVVEFFGNESKLSLTSFVHPKALELNSIYAVEEEINKISKGLLDFVTDWKTDLKNTKNQKILVCGSYYFVGEVQRFILSHS